MFPYLIAGAIGYAVAKIFEDETPKYADGGFIKIKSFKSNEGEFDVYDIDENHKNRADIFVVFKDKKGWVVRNVIVPKEFQRKGIATKFYINMNKMSLKNTGKPLHSTQTRKLSNGQIVHELSEDGIAFWDSLVRDGYAKKVSEKNYVFIHNEYADGGSVLLAPNGKPSNLTPEQYKLVRTKAFKDWFGDWENDPENASKVVDSNGEPLVVFHGSNNKFNVFSYISNRYFFSDNLDVANSYRNKYVFKEDEELGIDENEYEQFSDIVKLNETPIYEVFLKIINPKIKDYKNANWLQHPIEIDIYKNKDGLIANNIIDGGSISATTYICFNSNQIKLADGTNTTFDGNNPDIRYKTGGEIKDLVEDVSTEFLNSIRNQDKSLWNYDLEKSIEKQGILEPVTIGYWSEYDKITLIDGHHRLDTAIDLDIKSIPTIIELYYNNPIGKHRLYQAPKYNPNAKKPSDLGIFKKGGRTL